MTNPLAQDLGGVVRLLDCPGCGHPVDQEECPYPSGLRTSVDGRAMYAVNCVNNECGWQARGWGADGARKAWNTRTHSAEIAGALLDAERWQTIESAPRDGSEVWAYNGEQARMHWIEGEGYALWAWSDELLSDADPNPEQPTHWRPLPAPPTQDSAMQQGGGGGDHA